MFDYMNCEFVQDVIKRITGKRIHNNNIIISRDHTPLLNRAHTTLAITNVHAFLISACTCTCIGVDYESLLSK